jgi:A/G-specific adenine glycosylase
VPDPLALPPAAREAILAWYERHGRSLPFRATADPYAVLVSETMAQQTQAARAGEAWLRFVALFPTVSALAAAAPAEVLRAWQGLGYNRRALNLWRAAGRIVEEHGGRVPADVAALEALPGVGPYTARAVAAIGFGQPIGAVDTNVRRVLGRIVAGAADGLAPTSMQALADQAVPRGRSAAWTHAVMDLGATICRPRRPICEACPALEWCRFAARREGRAAADGAAHDGLESGGRPAPRERPAPFVTTSRWLRGRIVDRLRAASDGSWTPIDGPIGSHGRVAVAAALATLAREGLIEIDRTDAGAGAGAGVAGLRARLPIG